MCLTSLYGLSENVLGLDMYTCSFDGLCTSILSSDAKIRHQVKQILDTWDLLTPNRSPITSMWRPVLSLKRHSKISFLLDSFRLRPGMFLRIFDFIPVAFGPFQYTISFALSATLWHIELKAVLSTPQYTIIFPGFKNISSFSWSFISFFPANLFTSAWSRATWCSNDLIFFACSWHPWQFKLTS